MIIVEGMDNTGKTRLSAHLAQKFGLVHVKSPKDRTNLVGDALTLLILNPREAVLDRFSVISEAIYGPILRGGTKFDGYVGQWKFYMEKLVQCRPLILYCKPPDTKILDFGSREQMEGVVEHSEELLEAYDVFVANWTPRIPIITYDFTLPDTLTFVEYVVKVHLLGGKINEYK